MDHQKSWLWKKKSSSERTVDKLNLPFRGNEEEIVMLLSEKAELENDLNSLKEKLTSALVDSNAKDDFIKKHAKMAQEAREEGEKMEAKMVSLKKELDDTLLQRGMEEERIAHLDAALKECMQQLRFVRDEQEERIHDAVVKASNEFEKSRKLLEAKLEDSGKRIAKLGVDNNNLSKALLGKEKMIEDLRKQKAQLEVDISALISRLEVTEKDNVSLKYEVRLVEKDLEIRNEEREFNRRTSEASHKQHLESVKKIAKLESECQRLRVLVRKRLPGPAALAKMKSEVEVLGRDSNETRRRRLNHSHTGSLLDDSFSDNAAKKIDLLTEQLYALEDENKNLKETLNKKANELQFSRSMYARTASKLSQVESHFDEVSKGSATLETSRNGHNHDLSLASMSDIGSDDKASCAESWASALISELEHFKNGKQRGSPSSRTVGASDMSLMDDFVEMEKLAIVSVDNQSRIPVLSNDANAADACSLEVKGREIVPVLDACSNSDIKSNHVFEEAPYWLQDILKVVLEKSQTTGRKPHEILEDVRVALATSTVENDKMKESSDNSNVAGLITWKPTEKSDLSNGVTAADVLLHDKIHQQLQEDLSKSMHKIIELLEGIPFSNPNDGASETLSKKSFSPYKETTSGYIVRLFQWKSSELSGVLKKFVHTCYDLLNGKTDVNRFAQELTSALEWILNHCFSLQDVSSMRESIRKHFDWDDGHSEGEAEAGMIDRLSDVDKSSHMREKSLSTVAASNGHHNYSEMDKFHSTVRDENKKLNVESAKEVLEEQVNSATSKTESLMNQLQESEKTMSFRAELESFKKSEPNADNHKLIKEDLDTTLKMSKAELNEALHKLSILEVELENKNSSCEELEATCLELQLQLESVTKTTIPKDELHKDEKQLRTDWEITAASEKLAECQETILNLGKQLKALASPTDAALFEKVIPADTNVSTTRTPELTETDDGIAAFTSAELTARDNKLKHQRSSLLDRMIAEDNAKLPNVKDTEQPSSAFVSSGVMQPLEKILILKNQENEKTINSLAIVPSKKVGGGSLWKKLLRRKKKSRSKIPPMPFAP